MKNFITFAALFLSAIPTASSKDVTIVVDHRAENCEVGSRIAEGNRRRSEIEARRLARQAKKDGDNVRVVVLETGEIINSTDGTKIFRSDCR